MDRQLTEEDLIRLFTMDGKPYLLRYRLRGWQRKGWLSDLPVLRKMIADKNVELLEKDFNTITYRYIGKEPQTSLFNQQ